MEHSPFGGISNPHAPFETAVIPTGSLAFGTGTPQSVFAAPGPGEAINVAIGTAAAPDTTYAPAIWVSRTTAVPEAAFAGAGEAGLAGITSVVAAVATAQGQAIGLFGGATTASSYVGAKSHADAIGVVGVGRSLAGSTREGIGGFVNGRRDEAGIATGIQVAAENFGAAGVYEVAGNSNTKGISLTPGGTADLAAAIETAHPVAAAHWLYGIAFKQNSVTLAGYRDDTEAERSILIRGKHAQAAIAVAAGAGGIVVGAETPTAAGALLEVQSAATADPLVQFGLTVSAPMSVVLGKTSSGNYKGFVANAANQFLTGTAQGDSGLAFTPGKVFHIGAQEKASQLRISEAGIGMFGVAPHARPEVTGATVTAAQLAEALQLIGAVKVN